MTVLLFVSTVMIWGSTWIAITWQVGSVPETLSVFYRFALAGPLFIIGLALLGRLQVPAPMHHPWLVAQALCLFSVNFLCFYRAAAYVPSGLISVVFSLATIFNSVNARVFFNERITVRTLVAGALGTSGLVLLFSQEVADARATKILPGIALAVLGTLFFSWGNMVSRRISSVGLSPMTANAWSMSYGAVLLFAVLVVTDTPIVVPVDRRYLTALLYLATVGSIIGFTTYLMLVARVGSTRAAYATVLFPIVALSLSTVFEGYRWNVINSVGVLLALAGNVILFAPKRPCLLRVPARARSSRSPR